MRVSGGSARRCRWFSLRAEERGDSWTGHESRRRRGRRRSGETAVQRRPAMALAARCRGSGGRRAARTRSRVALGREGRTAACSAVSTQPMPMPASDEADGEQRHARAGERRSRGRRRRSGDAAGEDEDGAAAVAEAAGREADERGGDVVGRVEGERELGRARRCRGWAQQLGGAQDQQRRGDVAELERADAGEQPAELPVQHRPDRKRIGWRSRCSGRGRARIA